MSKPKIKKPAVPATPPAVSPEFEARLETCVIHKDLKAAADKTTGKAKPKPSTKPSVDTDKPTSKLLAYRAWKKAPKSADAELLYKATGERVKRETCAAWISFWKRGLNLPREAKEAEAKAKVKAASSESKKEDKK
jgi:hypothetical protein